ncbi:hypothetical protein [Streptomyces sp. NPDC094144]|uniref:DUF7574 domain-containing protein n=1 Tax=Streptomyces sp. NPDC094144 TaxID=3366056 RepID=UPI003816F2B2
MSNLYYSPESHGARILGDVDTADSYEFSMFVAWQRVADGAVFYGTDSGCSCPSPFEDLSESDPWSELTQVHDATKFTKVARTWVRESSYSGASAEDKAAMERLISKTRQALKAKDLTK